MSELIFQSGVILKKIPYGDADEIITVLLARGGVQRIFVPGARKSKKRFSGLIDHFAHLQFEFLVRPGLWRLQRVEECLSFDGQRRRFWEKDLCTYAFFSYMAELICEFMPEELHDHHVFPLWQDAVVTFEQQGFILPQASRFLNQLLVSFGYQISDEPVSGKTHFMILNDLISHARQILQKSTKAERFLLQIIQES